VNEVEDLELGEGGDEVEVGVAERLVSELAELWELR